MLVGPAGDVRSGRAADVDHGVVNRIADAADVFFGGARGGADDGGLDHGDAERGKNEDDADEEAERDGVANGREPGSGDGADEEVGSSENQIGDRERATEAETVGDCSTENGEKPNHAAENAGERAGLLGGEIEFFLEVDGEGREGAVVGEALEDFGDVGDPEGALEAVADFGEAVGEGHWLCSRAGGGGDDNTGADG